MRKNHICPFPVLDMVEVEVLHPVPALCGRLRHTLGGYHPVTIPVGVTKLFRIPNPKPEADTLPHENPDWWVNEHMHGQFWEAWLNAKNPDNKESCIRVLTPSI